MLKEYCLQIIRVLDSDVREAHFHDAVEVIFVLQGSSRACCNGVYYDQPAGSVLFVPPQVIHSYDRRSEDFRGVALIVEMQRICGLISYDGSFHPENPVWLNEQMDHPVWMMLQTALDTCRDIDEKSAFLMACGIINEVMQFYTFIKQTHQGSSFQKVLNYCQLHYKEPITVRSIAKELSLSEGHISHLFTNRLHQSFPDYINALRINEATRLMRDAEHTMTDICEACGFNSIRTFNRAFLKHFGISPRQYRKEHNFL